MPRYRFGDYVLSPRRRMLLRGDLEQPLIPRYFDLLVFLIEHRHEAVHRRDIFDRVWRDVIVSDSALSQAIRTIRRVLGDDPREPRFIRTVSRHGYRFAFEGVVEEEDDGGWAVADAVAIAAPIEPEVVTEDRFELLFERLTSSSAAEEERREAAELLHSLGTSEALVRLGTRPGHASARALLRDTRWDVPGAGPVPLIGAPTPAASAAALIGLRLRRAAHLVGARWMAASLGGGAAGLFAGIAGGLLLALLPGSAAPLALSAVLGAVGAVCGAIGGAGVGAGVAVAESVARSRRNLALVAGAAAGGGLAGSLAQWLGRSTLSTLVGVHVQTGGGIEGIVIGAAAGLAYALGTRRADGGLAAPRGSDRARSVWLIALGCGLAALTLTLSGRALVGGTIHQIAKSSQGAQAALTPLARFVGEPDLGPVSGALVGTGEGALFGLGLALGLTRKP